MQIEYSRFREFLRTAISPLVRFAVKNGVRLQDVVSDLKLVFTQEARRVLEEEGQKISASKITALSGVHRKDVGTILESHLPPSVSSIDPVAKVITIWESDKRFVDEGKGPKALTYKAAQSEFAQLVREVTLDIPAATLVSELVRRGLAEKRRGKLALVEGYNRLPKDPSVRFQNLATNVNYLYRAATENLFTDREPRNAHLRTEFDNLSSNDIEELRAWILDENIAFHKKLREKLATLERDLNPLTADDSPCGVSVTSYSLTYQIDDAE